MTPRIHTAFLVAGVLAAATFSPTPAEAGWGGKATSTFKSTATGQKSPAKPPLPIMLVVPENNTQQVCLTSTKSWAQENGRVQGKAGKVWRENASGTQVLVSTFTYKKTKYNGGVAVRCKDLGALQKGDLVEVSAKFSSMKKTDVIGDKLVVTLSQAPSL